MKPTDPNPRHPPREWLAGYADGELSGPAREAVEAWLRADPEARSELANQELFGPGNVELWRKTRPPEPSEAAWANTLARIEQGERPPANIEPRRPPSPLRWWLAGVLAASTAVAASLFVVVALSRKPVPPEGLPTVPDVVEEDADPVYRVAGSDDVVIISLPEAIYPRLVVGEHPMGTDVARVATFEDVDIRAIAPDARGEFPGFNMTPHGAAFPMVWPSGEER
jgi:hypothetical protein